MAKKQEAVMIINALKSGLAPLVGVQHILVDRELSRRILESNLEKDNENNLNKQHFYFIADFFGNGKTVFGHFTMAQAVEKNYLVAKLSLNRGVNFNKLDTVYNLTIEQLTHSNNFDPSFDIILNTWIESNTRTEIQEVVQSVKEICEGFSEGLQSYYDNYLSRNLLGQFRSLQQLKGAKAITVSRKKGEKLSGKLTKSNAMDYFKALDYWVKAIGYKGLFIIFDEVESILNLINKKLRHQAYENITRFCVAIENDEFRNLIAVFMLTPDLRDNIEKGIHSYRPLENFIIQKFTHYENITTIVFQDLTYDHQIELAKKICELHQLAFEWDASFKITDSFIDKFTKYFNHPLVSKYITIRRYVRQFLDILDVASQNTEFYPQIYISELMTKFDVT